MKKTALILPATVAVVGGAVANVSTSDDLCTSIHGLQCYGDDIKDAGWVSSHTDCCNLCTSTPGCAAWTWNWNEDGHCWVKKGCTDKRYVYGYHSGTGPAGPTPAPTPAPPTPPPVPTPSNPLGIVPNPVRSKNFFLIISDQGHDGGPNGCTSQVSTNMQNYAKRKQDEGNTLLFVAAIGDNFYNIGISNEDQWDKQWANVYGVKNSESSLYNIPWLAVMGNHDYGGADPGCACGKYCRQLSTAPPLWYMPDRYWNYFIPGIDLEILGLDTNAVDVSGLGGDGCKGHSPQVCNTCGWGSEVQDYLNKIKQESEDMLEERAKATQAKTTLIIQHYNWGWNYAVGADVLKKFREANGYKSHALSAYGHKHEQQCEGDRTYGCDTILTGGGAGWRGGTYFGFTAVWLKDDGSYWADVESSEVRFYQSQCSWWGSGAVGPQNTTDGETVVV